MCNNKYIKTMRDRSPFDCALLILFNEQRCAFGCISAVLWGSALSDGGVEKEPQKI